MLLALGAAVTMYGTPAAHAVTTPQYGLFNTGIDPGIMMGVDAHYTVALEGAATPISPLTYVTDPTGIPFSPADNATSAFISPQPTYAQGQIDAGGYYDFTTTFDLTGVTDLSAVSIYGRFETDDTLDNISLNGQALFTGPLTNPTLPGYYAFTGYYNLVPNTNLLTAGVNTFTFRVFNYTNSNTDPVSLRAEFSAVPEPSTWAMVGGLGAVAAFGGWMRRRRATV